MFSPPAEHRFSSPGSSGGSEPMTLGSPISSPIRNGQPNINFLPSYLLRGDVPSHASPTSSPSIVDWRSPTVAKQIADPFIVSQMSPSVARKSLFQPTTPNPMSQVLNSPNVTKPGGPPVQSLFDSVSSPQPNTLGLTKVDHTPKPSTYSQQFKTRESPTYNGVLTPNKSFSHNMSTYMSPAQIDPFYTQGEALTSESKLDESWITIFGFPPAATNYILKQFSNYGKIIDEKLATKGNWIHIRYQSKLQAKKALSKNGKVFGDNIMVGVKPCIEMDLMNDSGKENTSENELGTANFCQDNTFDIESMNSTQSFNSLRRLTVCKTPASGAEDTPKAKIEPKANNFVSKAMEYVFKW